MSQISEIKCPACGRWSKWTGPIGERCPHCHEYFNPGRIQYVEEQRLSNENAKKEGYLIIKENEDPIVQMFKQFVNWLRWATFYGISVIYFIIAFIIVLYGLAML